MTDEEPFSIDLNETIVWVSKMFEAALGPMPHHLRIGTLVAAVAAECNLKEGEEDKEAAKAMEYLKAYMAVARDKRDNAPNMPMSEYLDRVMREWKHRPEDN